jgi:hypothetical protein
VLQSTQRIMYRYSKHAFSKKKKKSAVMAEYAVLGITIVCVLIGAPEMRSI